MPNRLAEETSPYLLQHKDNPVDWLPWGEEAKRLAAERDLPILLSVGYSSCHWCHVMERESFENEAIAAQMNEGFIPVKVDREERPDVDAIYMEAVQAMTGHGGWPMTVFLDPDGVPFYGGTYFPPEPRGGMPSFPQVMDAVRDAWETKRDEIAERADGTRESLGAIARVQAAEGELRPELVDGAIEVMKGQADLQNGGFGGAPKFPPASAIDVLMARGETAIPERSLDAMMAGGIYDQLAGGFARYAVDAVWLVPHFEKMLYDNALLARSYLRGYQQLGHERYARICRETLDWALDEMRGPEGAFYSALDADSEGVEGKFYVWSKEEADAVLAEAGLEPDEITAVDDYLGISGPGNWEGTNVLNLRGGAFSPAPARWDEARAALLEARAKRIRPGLDDKRLTAWNGLMIHSLAEAGAVLDEPRYLEAATEATDFLLGTMRDTDGNLLRTYNRGEARISAYLEDHAYLLEALVALYEASFDPRFYDEAVGLADRMIDRFADAELGGFFTTADDHEELIVRRKDLDDHPIPSGNASAARGLLRLGALGGEGRYLAAAEGTLRLLATPVQRHPQALAYALGGLDLLINGVREVALIAPEGNGLAATAELATTVRSTYRPRVVLAAGETGTSQPPLLTERPAGPDGSVAAYVCEQFACQAPVSTPEALAEQLE